MNLQQIKHAISKGYTVCYKSPPYQVSKDCQRLECSLNRTAVFLEYKGALQGNEEDFYISLNRDIIINSFKESALWAEGLDSDYETQQFSMESYENIFKLVKNFISGFNREWLEEVESSEQVGHDLYLTVAGHGAGFWDGDYPTHGDAITKYLDRIARGSELYISDSGQVEYNYYK